LKSLNNQSVFLYYQGDYMINSPPSTQPFVPIDDDTKMEWRKLVEATLFKNSQPLSIIELHKILPQIPESLLSPFIAEITQDYLSYQSALQIRRFPDNKFGFVIRPDIMEESAIIHFTKKADLESTDVQILAFVAYNQPIELQDILDFLDKKAKRSIQLLEQQGYISAVRCKNDGIESCIYSTTPYFADYMGIPNDLDQIKAMIQAQYDECSMKPKRNGKKQKNPHEIPEYLEVSELPKEDKFVSDVSEEDYRTLVAKFDEMFK